MKKKVFVGVIPARGGSKGIPRKNIKTIAGKPLIAWTIEAAQQARLMDRFVVSTDDQEIADIARKYGAPVMMRPKHLATDTASTFSVLEHLLSKENADAIVLLQPTSPMRPKGLIDACIKKYKNTGADNVATGFVCKFKEYGTYSQRRQDLKGFFYDDGNVYVINAKVIKSGRMLGDKVARVLTSREENVEIDDDFDFWLAEQILLKNLKKVRR